MTSEIIRGIARQEAQQQVYFGGPSVQYTTADATPTEIPETLIELPIWTAGIVDVEVIAWDLTGAGVMMSNRKYGFSKDSGTINLETADVISEHTSLAADYDLVASSGNLLVEITGIAATDITWQIRVTNYSLTIEV